MNKLVAFMASIIIVFLITIVFGFSYLQNEINTLDKQQQGNTPAPSSNPTTAQTYPTFTPNSPTRPPIDGSPANLIVKIENITYEAMPEYHTVRFLVTGSITNAGVQTAYNVSIHTQVLGNDDEIVTDRNTFLSPYDPNVIALPNTDLSIAGGVTYRFYSSQTSVIPMVGVAQSYCLDYSGKLTSTTMNVGSYRVTPLWSNTPT
jgi:hypothetical protein